MDFISSRNQGGLYFDYNYLYKLWRDGLDILWYKILFYFLLLYRILLSPFCLDYFFKDHGFFGRKRPRLIIQIAFNNKNEYIPYIIIKNSFLELEKKYPTSLSILLFIFIFSAILSISRKQMPTIDDFEPAFDNNSSSS